MPGRAFPSLALGMLESRFLRDHPVVPNAEFRSQEAAMMSLGLETLDGRTSPTERRPFWEVPKQENQGLPSVSGQQSNSPVGLVPTSIIMTVIIVNIS